MLSILTRQRSNQANVRLWHKADIQASTDNVRFRGVKRTWRISLPSFTLRLENCGTKNPLENAGQEFDFR